MKSLLDFLHQNPIWVFLFCFAWVAWVAVIFAYRSYRHKKTGLVFPDVPSANIHFDERAASGCSYKTLFTRFGGARKCLHVTVTDTELWIRTPFPINAFVQQIDLEHRIPLASIMSAQPRRSAFAGSILLDYRDNQGQTHQLSLLLKKPDDFLKALGFESLTSS